MPNNKWLRSLSVIIIVALLLTVTSDYFPLGQNLVPFINGSVYATSDIHSIESTDADNEVEYKYPSQHKELQPDSVDGKVNVIIGFKGLPAKGIQQQAKFARQKTLVNNFGGEVKKSFTIINAVSARLPLQAIEALSRRPEVKYVEPDHKVTVNSQEIPWSISRIFGSEENLFPTWDNSKGQGIAIAVLDTGVDENHFDLPKLSGGVNTIDDTHWGLDEHGHGTHVAGIIAALDNNIGVVGVAPGADLYAVKAMDKKGEGSHSSVIAGIEWAYNNNIQIINMSVGSRNHSDSLKEAVDAAYENGTLLVASAGNAGDSKDNVFYPARYDSVIAVSASDRNDELATYSSRGPDVELIAPGSNILSLWPDNHMVHSSGTSMASPHVAGSAAVLWGADRNLSNREIRHFLHQTTEDLGLPNYHQGFGLVRADLALAKVAISDNKNLKRSTDLAFLEISKGILSPEFDPKEYNYITHVDYKIDSIDITAHLSDANQNITINGDLAACGVAKKVILNPAGTDSEIEIIASVEGSENEQIYTIVVKRESVPLTIPNLLLPFHGKIIQDSTIIMEWAPVAGATHYAIWIYNVTKDKLVFFEVVGEDTSYIHDDFPKDGDVYAWSVAANNIKENTWSNFAVPIVFINGSDKNFLPPILISPKHNSNIESMSVKLKWEPLEEATHYAVWVYNLTKDELVTFSNPIEETYYIIDGLTDNGDIFAWSVVPSNIYDWIWGEFAFPMLFKIE